MTFDPADAKKKIVEFCESKKDTKTKFYFNNFTEMFPDAKQRDVKKVLTELVKEEVMEYWSSGSTTLYGLKGLGKHAEGED